MNKIFPFILAFVLIATASHAQAQTTTSTSWKGVPYRVSRAMLKGDANGDGLINMSDVTLVINYILGRNIDDFSFDNAEVTGDGFINMSDVTAIIDIILGRIEEKKPQAYLTCPDDNHPHIIDLGLPSGTKWACCDVGVTAPMKHGSFYAWGSIEEMTVPYEPGEYDDWEDDGDGESNKGTFENSSLRFNKTRKDNDENICGTEHDVANVKWGGAWQMPSVEQLRELCDNSSISYDYIWNEDKDNYEDYFILSFPNGGEILFPLYPNYKYDDDYYEYGPYLENRYWSGNSSFDNNKSAWGLFLEIEDPKDVVGYFPSPLSEIRTFDYSIGASVRPIYNGESYGYLSLSMNEITFGVGDVTDVKISSGNGSYDITNSNSDVIDVSLSGTIITVRGKSKGNSTIIVSDKESGISSEIKVVVLMIDSCPDDNHPHMIDLGLSSGTKWACCNVGAEKPEAEGDRYCWGETEVSTDVYRSNDDPLYDIGDISGTEYDVAHVKWGESWCMPSYYLVEELINECSSMVASYHGVRGMVFTKTNGNSIFLPFAEFVDYFFYEEHQICGRYWTSCLNSWVDGYNNFDENGYAYYLSLLDDSFFSYISDRESFGLEHASNENMVRPIIKGYNLILSESNLTCYPTDSCIVRIVSGSGNYTYSISNSGVVEVTIEGSAIIIKGKSAGVALITVTDTTSGMTSDITITVRYKDLRLDKNRVSMYSGETTKVRITSGNGSYTVSNTSPSVIDVSLSGSTITITGKAAGKATLTVTDTTSGMTADIIVTVSYKAFVLDANEVALLSGETTKVNITSGNGTYSASCSNPSIVDVTFDGSMVIITGKEKGVSTVTVYDDLSGNTADITVTVSAIILCPDDNHPHLIDLGLPSGTKWACCNVGATSPEANGGYYAWGETEEKDVYSWATYIHCDGTSDTCHDLGESISGTEYDVAYMKWGDAYQMPSFAQIKELANKCQFKVVSFKGVEGKLVIGNNGNKLFIPFAGMRKDKSFSGLGDNGKYFSGSRNDSDYAYILLVDKKYTYSNYVYRSYGLTVRPVSK